MELSLQQELNHVPYALNLYDAVAFGHIHHFMCPDYIMRGVDGCAFDVDDRYDVGFDERKLEKDNEATRWVTARLQSRMSLRQLTQRLRSLPSREFLSLTNYKSIYDENLRRNPAAFLIVLFSIMNEK